VLEQIPRALHEIFAEGYYSDKVIERILKKNRKWGGRDRRFFAEAVYDIVRWWRFLWVVLRSDALTDEDAIWLVLGVWLVYRGYELPKWNEFYELKDVPIANALKMGQWERAERESIPDWLDERGMRELGERWPKTLEALNLPAWVVLRTNSLKTTREKLKAELLAEGIDLREDKNYPSALILNVRKNVFKSEVFKKGWFEVQDASSQLIAPFLQVEKGMRVWDACAGAGGKSLHIAALMENKGKIIATDIHQWKLDELRKRAARGGVDVIETRLIDNQKTIKRMDNSMDRVLLDVPCSGIGVLKRNPDTKWKLSNEELERLSVLQASLLETYSPAVKKNGKLVYATCSIFPSENHNQIEKFLQNHSDFKLEEELFQWPEESGYDGFYAARLIRQ
jgi:16S rRNA (cytosine967-C5)-methyltransferase